MNKLAMFMLFISLIFAYAQAKADIFDVISTVASGGGAHKQESAIVTPGIPERLISVTTPAERIEISGKVTDQTLLKEFYILSQDGTSEDVPTSLVAEGFAAYEIEAQRLVICKPLYRLGDLPAISNWMQQEYASTASSDAVAKRFVAQAKKRGNVVKMYRRALNIEVNQAVEKATGYFVKYASSKVLDASQDNVLIETSPSGEMVSIVSRNHQVKVMFGAEDHLFVQIIYGRKTLDAFENLVTYEKLRDMYIRDL